MLTLFRSLTPLGKLIGALVVAVVVIGALWTAYRRALYT